MRPFPLSVLLVVTAAVASAATYLVVNRQQPEPSPVATIGTVREIMNGMVDPASDGIFESVASVSNASGIVDKAPHTDEEWAAVEGHALTLAEAAALLTVSDRRVARPDEVDRPGDPNAPELTAAEIQMKIDADRAKWLGYAAGLQQAALKARDITRKRDADALFEVGDAIDTACENCHLEYWYPPNHKPGSGQTSALTPAPAPAPATSH